MIRFLSCSILLLLCGPAAAQQGTPQEQALAGKLVLEINSSLQCSAEAITLRAEVKRLTDKYEPKTEPKKAE